MAWHSTIGSIFGNFYDDAENGCRSLSVGRLQSGRRSRTLSRADAATLNVHSGGAQRRGEVFC